MKIPVVVARAGTLPLGILYELPLLLLQREVALRRGGHNLASEHLRSCATCRATAGTGAARHGEKMDTSLQDISNGGVHTLCDHCSGHARVHSRS